MNGTIKVLKNGFGFITPEDGSKDLFFHVSDLEGIMFNELSEGDAVTFEEAPSDRGGMKAAKVAKA